MCLKCLHCRGGELIFAEVESSESAIAYCGLGGSAMFALKENGSLYSTAQSEWENMNRSLSYVVSAFSYGGSIFAVTEDLQLHYLNYDPTNGNLIDAKVIAEDVVLCYPLGGNEGCLYVTSNGSLHSWSSIGDSIDFKLGE